MSEPNLVDKTLSEFAEVGELVDEGRFTLDREVAQDRMRQHLLANRHGYVLLLVEISQLAGRNPSERAIDFEFGTSTTVTFRCPSLTCSELCESVDCMFVSAKQHDENARSRILQLLALSLHTMLGLDDAEVRVEHVDPQGQGWSATFNAGGRAARTVKESRSSGRMQIQLHSQRLASRKRIASERSLLTERCQYTRGPVRIDGIDIAQGWLAALRGLDGVEPKAVVDIEHAGAIIGHVALRPRRVEAEFFILTRGVLTETVMLQGKPPGFAAIVDIDVSKDLAQARVLRDATYHEIRGAIDDAHERLSQTELSSQTPKPELAIAEAHESTNVLPWLALLLLAAATLWLLVLTQGAKVESPDSTDGTQSQSQLQRTRCQEGRASACLELGREHRSAGQLDAARAMLLKICSNTETLGCVDLARVELERGQVEHGLELLRQACERGQMLACVNELDVVHTPHKAAIELGCALGEAEACKQLER